MSVSVRVIHGDCLSALPELAAEGVLFDAVVCDPPYHLSSIVKRFGAANAAPAMVGQTGAYARASKGFMGKEWDGGDVAFRPETWAAVLAVMKPGAHLVAFSGTRTYHRMACAIEDAGFEIRDQLAWAYGSGFPKSHDISKAIDKAAGAERTENVWRDRYHDGKSRQEQETGSALVSFGCDANGNMVTLPATEAARQWAGWGSALKPAWEPICLARKPLEGTLAGNTLAHGCGGLNIDGCRVGTTKAVPASRSQKRSANVDLAPSKPDPEGSTGFDPNVGRWPANLVHDGSPEVLAGFPDTSSGGYPPESGQRSRVATYGVPNARGPQMFKGSEDSAARFFKSANYGEDELLLYEAKAIVEAWNSVIANTADSASILSSEAVVFALSDAVTWAFRATPKKFLAPSTSVTPTELRRISEAAIMAMLTIGKRCWQGSQPEKHFPNGCHVKIVATQKQTGTITITISRWKSNGSAEPVTFSITPPNLELGEADFQSAPRLYYSSKADAADRLGSKHPTVKPVDLMAWLCRLVTPPGGLVLDPFAGSGTTGMACMREGFRAVLIEREAEYVADIHRRLAHVKGEDAPLFGGGG